MSHYKKAILALIVANTIWGASSPIYKWSFQSMSPLTFAFCRFALATLILLFFVKKMQWIKPKDYILFIMLGIFNCLLNNGLYFLGLFYAPSIDAPVISSAGPIFVLFASAIFLKEKTTKKLLFGNLVGLTGVLFIVLQPAGKLSQNHSIFGNILFLTSTIAAAFATIFAKKLAKKYNFFTLSFWTFFMAAISFAPAPIYEFLHHTYFALSIQTLYGILFGAIGASILAYILFFYGLKYIDASQTTSFAYIDPVSAVFIAIPLVHEYPTTIYFIGGTLILLGIYIAEGRIHWHPLHKLLK